MSSYSLLHLEADVLLRDLTSLVKQERVSTAVILTHLAEVEARRLYRPAGYASMFAYCLGALGMSEDAAGKRLYAARAARRFPVLFHAVADGRLHLTAVDVLAAPPDGRVRGGVGGGGLLQDQGPDPAPAR